MLAGGRRRLDGQQIAELWFARQVNRRIGGREFARRALLINAWLYFGLNYAFFNFPWPWQKWTSRTPNEIAFAVCVVGLTIACITLGRRGQPIPGREISS